MKNDNELSSNYLLDKGIVMLSGTINEQLAQVIVAQLQFLSCKYPQRPIQLWINSGGGEVTSGMAIYDVINHVKPEVHTIAMGLAASMAAVLLSSGTRGKRCALPNAEILIHQPLGGAQGQATDVINAARHIERIRNRINYILARNTGKTVEQIAVDTDRDYIMTAEEAVSYGLVDMIIDAEPKAWC